MRVLSPRIEPPLRGLDGSTASTATLVTEREQVHPERFDEGALADAGRAGDAESHRVARMRHQLFEDRLAELRAIGAPALEQRDRLRQRATIAAAHAVAPGLQRGGVLRAAAHARFARIAASTSRAAFGTGVPGPKTAATPPACRSA